MRAAVTRDFHQRVPPAGYDRCAAHARDLRRSKTALSGLSGWGGRSGELGRVNRDVRPHLGQLEIIRNIQRIGRGFSFGEEGCKWP